MKSCFCLGLLCLLLNACASLNDKFDCPAPQGGSCKRMDEVYAMVNGKKRLIALPAQIPVANSVNYSEGMMRLWIAPFKDSDGNYHQANQVYSVVREQPVLGSLPIADK